MALHLQNLPIICHQRNSENIGSKPYCSIGSTEFRSKSTAGRDRKVVRHRATLTSESPAIITKEVQETKASLHEIWRKVHGQDDWAHMLDPFHPLLRSELIRYGEMAQACYDAFNRDPYSKYCGSCKFKPADFFESLGKKHFGYEVTAYLYSAYNINFPKFFKRTLHLEAWSPSANWTGYVAVSDDKKSKILGRRDITIAWRGTVMKNEWLADLTDFLKPVSSHGIPSHDQSIKAELGFLHLYTDKDSTCTFTNNSAREQIIAEVRRLTRKYAKEKLSITITGHSLGSALAILSGYDIAETGGGQKDNGETIPICVFSFSGPRVGNGRFKDRLDRLGVKVLRVVNIHDKVPQSPGLFFNEHTTKLVRGLNDMLPWSYSHVGMEIALDHTVSPFLKETNDLACCHNLEAHLHLLDGYHGKGTRFWCATGRDIALVNKDADFLKEDHLIPPYWLQAENKGLVMNCLGQWVMPELADLEDHLPPDHRLQQPDLK